MKTKISETNKISHLVLTVNDVIFSVMVIKNILLKALSQS